MFLKSSLIGVRPLDYINMPQRDLLIEINNKSIPYSLSDLHSFTRLHPDTMYVSFIITFRDICLANKGSRDGSMVSPISSSKTGFPTRIQFSNVLKKFLSLCLITTRPFCSSNLHIHMLAYRKSRSNKEKSFFSLTIQLHALHLWNIRIANRILSEKEDSIQKIFWKLIIGPSY